METEHLSLSAWAFSLVMPGIMMVLMSCSLFLTALRNPRLLVNFQIEKLQSKSFGLCWSLIGDFVSNDFPGGLEAVINENCSGMVLDIGPGSGFQLKRFEHAFEAGNIDEIYGVEPAVEMHDQLRAQAIKVFNGDAPKLYKVLSCGAQPDQLIPYMSKNGLLKVDQAEGLFDTILCIRAFCGIPQPQETADLFYHMLKPGGKIIFFEHVRNSGDVKRSGSGAARILQQFYMLLGHKFLAGGCELTRDTTSSLRRAATSDGGWAKEQVMDRNPEGCVPEVWGYMQKKVKEFT